MEPLHHYRVPLDFVPDYALVMQFFVPFSVEALDFELTIQRKTVGRRSCFLFSCVPQRILRLDRVYIAFPPKVWLWCCVYICNPKRNGWHICEHFLPKSCLFIYHCRTKTCGWRQAGDWFSYYRLRMDISIMSLFVIHDNTTLY